MVVSGREQRATAALLGGFGAALGFGGLFAAIAMIVVPFQVGLADLWSKNAFGDPAFYIFAGFGIFFLIVAGGGTYLCRRAYHLYRTKRPSAGGIND